MRRPAQLGIAAVILAASLSACSGAGGTGFSSDNGGGSIDHVVFTNSAGQANVFSVGPNGVAPLGLPGPAVAINAQGTKGSQQFIVPGTTFAWNAAFASSGSSYASNNEGQLKDCGIATPTGSGLLPDISVYSPTRAALYWQPQGPTGAYVPVGPQDHTNQVFLVAPDASGPNGVGPAPAPEPQNYCITVTAFGSGATASVQVAVTNSP